MADAVQTGAPFSLGGPKLLFKSIYYGMGGNHIGHPWGISSDGKRFAMIKPPTAGASAQREAQPKINIVVNWFEELRERVPVE
jgi:hypothetical protein